MRFLSVAERELRAAARQKAMYRLRWVTAVAFFLLLLWLGWVYDVFENRQQAPEVFQVFSIAVFLNCLFLGAAATADCISRERRDGTLGLLFLTNLNSAEIVAGKLCSNALVLIYSLLAIFPLLALPVLVGGVGIGHFWRVVLALVNALFFAVAAGFTASSVCVRQFPAVALALGLSLFFGTGLLAVASIVRSNAGTNPIAHAVADAVASLCPLHTLLRADEGRLARINYGYWYSLVAVAGMSWVWLAAVAWRLKRTWRDRPKTVRAWGRFQFLEKFRSRGHAARVALRRRLLEINPFFWLAGRQRVSAPVFMALTVALVLITTGVTAPYFGKVIAPSFAYSPVFGQLFAWLWTGLAIHALVLYYGAVAASQRLAEDKQTGALELILSTPATERSISRGLWLAYGRRMFFPVLVAVLAHFFFTWICMTMAVLEPPGKLPPNITTGQVFWAALWDLPLKGHILDWHFGFMLRCLLLFLVTLAANWLMLGWLGRWLGLRLKHPGFVPMIAVALAVVPPILEFSLACYLASEWKLYRMPERQFLPLMMWVTFGIVILNCLLLSVWAAGRLHRDFRATVINRFQPSSERRWWRPGRRAVLRFAIGVPALAAALALLVLLFFGYHNWQSRRRWTVFQREVKQRGESLDLSALLPGAVPDEKNFARAPAFQIFLNQTPTNKTAAYLLRESLKHGAVDTGTGVGFGGIATWTKQGFADLNAPLLWMTASVNTQLARMPTTVNTNPPAKRKAAAPKIWDALKPLQADLAAAAEAAQLPHFRATTNRNATAVYETNRRELATLEQLNFLFQLRASALLALDRAPEAVEDVLTSLRLAQLARQSPDAKSSLRVQALLTRALQPLWEGLAERRWNESQLAALQRELAKFNLLADHTNVIHRIVLAHVETWRAIPLSKGPVVIPQAGGGFADNSDWEWQPRVRWYDNSVQIYQAGQNAMARVNFATGRISDDYDWSDLNGLPMESATQQLFQQGSWWGASSASVSFAQTAVNQGVIACALERYRLAHGAFPATLDQLVPAYLDRIPRDISRGLPMFYLHSDKDIYELRGAGPNGIIEQGKPSTDDWPWSFTSPTNSPPAKVIKKK